MSGQGQGDIVKELPHAAFVHNRAEQDEQEDVAGGYAYGRTVDTFRVGKEMVGQGRPVITTVHEHAGELAAEEPVYDKDQRQNRQGIACDPAGTFQYQLIAGEYEYSYGIAISYSKSEIISEWLVRIDKNKNEFVIFDRNVNEDQKSIVETDISAKQFKDSERIRIYFEDFSENISDTLRKKTMLSDLATRGSHKDTILNEIVAVYEWFKKILILFPEFLL